MEITMTDLINVMTLCIRAGGNDIKEKVVKDYMVEVGLMESIRVVTELLTIALNVEDETEEKKTQTE